MALLFFCPVSSLLMFRFLCFKGSVHCSAKFCVLSCPSSRPYNQCLFEVFDFVLFAIVILRCRTQKCQTSNEAQRKLSFKCLDT